MRQVGGEIDGYRGCGRTWTGPGGWRSTVVGFASVAGLVVVASPSIAADAPPGTPASPAASAVVTVATGSPDPSAPAQPVAPPVDPPLASDCAHPSTTLVEQTPWAVRRLGFAAAWNLTQGAGVTVAVVDTGVDGGVPQLGGRVLRGVDVTGERVPADTDCAGHGTFVAGIVAAAPAEGTGVAGVAPAVTVLPIRQASSETDGTSTGLAAGIRAAVDEGAAVITISTSAFFSSDPLREAVSYAEERDVVVVAAVANQAQNGNPQTFPAAYPEVLAVGAIDENGAPASFSEAGDYVDVSAPGVGIVSLSAGGPGHLVGEGTSYATPYVAGVAALIRSYRPELTAAQVRHRIEITADRPGGRVPDPQLGWGVVNPVAAVSAELAEEDGPGAMAGAGPEPAPGEGRIVAPRPAATDHHARTVAMAFAAAACGAALLGVLGMYAFAAGRRRGWRPGDAGR